MTRTLTCLIAGLAGLTTLAPAQGSVALKGGLSYGNVSNRGVLPGNLSERTGFAAGLALGTGRNMLGFGIEALYAQRGVTGSAPDERKLDYIDVPVFLRARFRRRVSRPTRMPARRSPSSCDAGRGAAPAPQEP